MASRRPKKLSLDQRQAFAHGFEAEGRGYYLLDYIEPRDFEAEFGKLPKDVLDAWRDFIKANEALESVLREHKAWSVDDLPEPDAEG